MFEPREAAAALVDEAGLGEITLAGVPCWLSVPVLGAGLRFRSGVASP
jgi:hypothetical protein